MSDDGGHGTALNHYRSCGLRIASDRSLPGVRPSDAIAEPDLHLLTGLRRHIPDSLPTGQLLIDPKATDGFFGAVERDEGALIRFFGRCDVHVTADARVARYDRDPRADGGVLDVLLAGSVIAAIASIRDTCAVLHASAVEFGGAALAFVGHSGMGKSTLALAGCAAGANLVAEDVLGVLPGEPPTCLPGNTDIRLRKRSKRLLDRLPEAPRVHTPDGHAGVRPQLATPVPIPLGAVVIPHPSRQIDAVRLHRLRPVEGFFRLMNFPRIAGFRSGCILTSQFLTVGMVARSVPIFAATIPWRPIPDDLGDLLLGLLNAASAPGSSHTHVGRGPSEIT